MLNLNFDHFCPLFFYKRELKKLNKNHLKTYLVICTNIGLGQIIITFNFIKFNQIGLVLTKLELIRRKLKYSQILFYFDDFITITNSSEFKI